MNTTQLIGYSSDLRYKYLEFKYKINKITKLNTGNELDEILRLTSNITLEEPNFSYDEINRTIKKFNLVIDEIKTIISSDISEENKLKTIGILCEF